MNYASLFQDSALQYNHFEDAGFSIVLGESPEAKYPQGKVSWSQRRLGRYHFRGQWFYACSATPLARHHPLNLRCQLIEIEHAAIVESIRNEQ